MVVTCAGCTRPIVDKFLLNVLDQAWHSACVLCTDCLCPLTDRCFSRNGKLYCKDDFFRRFGTKCSGCRAGISPLDLVRRAGESRVYHVDCFTCVVCRKRLSTGDQLYILDEDRLICREDFIKNKLQQDSLSDEEEDVDHVSYRFARNSSTAAQKSSTLNNNFKVTDDHDLSDGVLCDYDDDDDDDDEDESGSTPLVLDISKAGRTGGLEKDSRRQISMEHIMNNNNSKSRRHNHNRCSRSDLVGHADSVSGVVRDIKIDKTVVDAFGDSLLDDSNCSDTSSNSGCSEGRGEAGLGGSSNNDKDKENCTDDGDTRGGGSEGQSMVGVGGGVGGGTKRRGPRTTIKAKQLETLKSAFAATPKPTRHIREQLAQETGLNMRVIQVWFQNRRSKERRMKQLSVMGARRQFFRHGPRRMRLLHPAEEAAFLEATGHEMIMVGGPHFNYFTDGEYFGGGYPIYDDYFPVAQQVPNVASGCGGMMSFLPPPPPPTSGQTLEVIGHPPGQGTHHNEHIHGRVRDSLFLHNSSSTSDGTHVLDNGGAMTGGGGGGQPPHGGAGGGGLHPHLTAQQSPDSIQQQQRPQLQLPSSSGNQGVLVHGEVPPYGGCGGGTGHSPTLSTGPGGVPYHQRIMSQPQPAVPMMVGGSW